MKVLNFPLAKISIFFIFGILFSKYFSLNPILVFTTLVVSILILFAVYFKKLKSFFGSLSLIISFLFGIATCVFHNETLKSNHYIHGIENLKSDTDFEITVLEKLKNSATNYRYKVEVVQINNQLKTGKLILNIKNEATIPILKIGSHLKLKGSIYKNRNPNNPSQFDYAKYLENQQVYGQVYVYPEDIKIGNSIDKNLNYYAAELRNTIIFNLKKNNFNSKELNVVIALILGQQQDISPEILKDYQYAGAIHVLSVSGLHVGFILIFITFLLKPIPNSKLGSLSKVIITLLSLVLFGVLAGLAPCVLRSVVMFSFLTIGNYLKRSVNIYHTLLVSILVILLFEPSFLFDVGFQLSYIALFFIVWLQPLFSSIYIPKNKLVGYFWDIITVSFAAQIGTLPLSIYYFHQFPGLFFITNLIILPFLTLILALGVVVVILAGFDFVWLPMMHTLEKSIWLLNKVIGWVASFEDFIFKDVPITIYMMWNLYLIIILFIIWAKKPSFTKLTISLVSVLLFQILLFQTKFKTSKTSEFIVFSQRKSTLICERNGKSNTIFANDSVLKKLNQNTVLKSFLVANFNSEILKKELKNLYYFKKNKIVVLDEKTSLIGEKMDVLILINSPKINLERLFLTQKPKQIVADGSNYKSYVKIWRKIAKKYNVLFHDTSENGFFKL